jgi:hypothetical protein
MKADPNISWSEKGELKYKGETVRGSNVVDLVNDVLRKRKYFNPQGWETFGEALREASVPPLQEMLGSAYIFRTNSSALVFIVFGALSTMSLISRPLSPFRSLRVVMSTL